MSSAIETLLASAEHQDGVYYLCDPGPYAEKEDHYVQVRDREARLYPDDVVRALPAIRPDHPLAGEWQARVDSLRRLLSYLAQLPPGLAVLDLGCGNGWMAHHLAALSGVNVYGLDLNRRELAQAVRVFGDQPRLKFLFGDVYSVALPCEFNLVVLASAIQYFPDLPALIRRLKGLLVPGGEIHILDSPLYEPGEVPAAQARSRAYYQSKGLAFMADDYHHHTRASLAAFQPKVLYNPSAPLNRLAGWWKRLTLAPLSNQSRSPFVWLKIVNQPG
jgi:SAM-dependent methyltransferase